MPIKIALILIALSLSFLVKAEANCPISSDTLNQIQQLASDMDVAAKWVHCERFGIKDRSILQTPQKIAPEVLSFYRQKKLQLEDPIGDFALTRVPSSQFNQALRGLLGMKSKPEEKELLVAAAACAEILFELEPETQPPMGVANIYSTSPEFSADQALLEKIIQKHFPQDGEKIRELFLQGKLEVEGHERPIDANQLSQELIDVIKEEEKKGVLALKGEKHRWSKEFKSERSKLKDFTKSLPSKILASLSGGKSEFLMRTEKEDSLEQFILEQKDVSLNPKELFRKSYQLNQGNVYLSLLTIENVLSKHWLHPKRNELQQTNKLKPFGKVFGSHGDVFGHWYHLFGMIYYGYNEGKLRAQVVGKVESVGSSVLSGFKGEIQENKVNMIGAQVGGNMKAYFKAKEENKPFELKPKKESQPDDWESLIVKKIQKELK